MWSDRYYYLKIYKDESLSSDSDTKELRDFIAGIPELVQTDKFEFKNKEPFPFTRLLILKAKNPDNWTEKDTNSKRTNLITIVCGKGEHVDFTEMQKVFIKIATFLNWKLVDEETDDGIENYTIWKPENKTTAQQKL